MSKRRSSPEFLKRRAELLQDNPLCHWCNKAPATEADHLIPYDLVGDDTELVPACKPCNSRRGAQYINGNRTAAAHSRAEHLGLDPTTKPKQKPNNPELFLKKEKIIDANGKRNKSVDVLGKSDDDKYLKVRLHNRGLFKRDIEIFVDADSFDIAADGKTAEYNGKEGKRYNLYKIK